MLGAYGEWAAAIVEDPPRLSYRRPEFSDLNSWRLRAGQMYSGEETTPAT